MRLDSMSVVALKMLTGDRAKYLALVFANRLLLVLDRATVLNLRRSDEQDPQSNRQRERHELD
jgi:hypothetical protein